MVGDIFHIVNRGIEKGMVFRSNSDYTRFTCGLHRFNNIKGAIRTDDDIDEYFDNAPKQEKMVNILKWCLMPNHYHLLVEELIDGGAVEFVKRIGNGYTKYFNTKNDRSGYLFQNSAKIIPIREDKHFLYIPFYIDSNPIKIIEPEWGKETPIKTSVEKLFNYLRTYKWSSFRDYFGYNNFPAIIEKESFFKTYETNEEKYRQEFNEWIVNNL